MRITDELLLLTDTFARHRVSYAICGGLAAVIHGRPIQILSRAGLIRMKRSSNRLKDKLDVELLNEQTD